MRTNTMSKPNNKLSITIIRGGPFVASGGIPLIQRYPAYSEYGEPLAWDPVGSDEEYQPLPEHTCLCRCGKSADKPLCDGTHINITFDDQPENGEPTLEYPTLTIEGEGVTLTDIPSLCAGTGFCGTRYTTIWKMIEKAADPETLTRLREMVRNCPSGRLLLKLDGEKEPDEPRYIPSIAAVPNGPLWVRGGIEVRSEDGTLFPSQNRMTLCRCGASRNKPYCDSTHEEIGFVAPLKE